jgi:hypothetical protein
LLLYCTIHRTPSQTHMKTTCQPFSMLNANHRKTVSNSLWVIGHEVFHSPPGFVRWHRATNGRPPHNEFWETLSNLFHWKLRTINLTWWIVLERRCRTLLHWQPPIICLRWLKDKTGLSRLKVILCILRSCPFVAFVAFFPHNHPSSVTFRNQPCCSADRIPLEPINQQ